MSTVPFEPQRITLRALIICLLAAMFYLYEFALQVSPAVMTDHLMRDLHTDAMGLGLMSSVFFYTYAPMMLWAGMLFDAYSARFLFVFSTIICALGAFFFSTATHLGYAAWGRALIGLGASFAFVGNLVLIGRWFPSRHFAMMTGVVQTLSSIGAIAGEVFLSRVVASDGWRATVHMMSALGFVLALLIFLLVRDAPQGHPFWERERSAPSSLSAIFTQMRWVLSHSKNIAVAFYALLVWAPMTVFAILFGVDFMTERFALSREEASGTVALVWLGLGVGSPFLGWLSEYLKSRMVPMYLAAFLGILSSLFVVYGAFSLQWTLLFLFFLGIAASGQSISFSMIRDLNDAQTLGTAVGFNNMVLVFGGALCQPLAGTMLSWASAPQMTSAPHYILSDYRWAFVILPLCYVISAGWLRCFLQESHPQKGGGL